MIVPPRLYSRHAFCTAQLDDAGRLYLSDRVPFGYRAFSDNALHTVGKGDKLWFLAARYFPALPRPAGLWWVIADFQPEPVFDPTVDLAEGSVLVIPSVRTVLTYVFAEDRRAEASV